jgi:hypothetical protein
MATFDDGQEVASNTSAVTTADGSLDTPKKYIVASSKRKEKDSATSSSSHSQSFLTAKKHASLPLQVYSTIALIFTSPTMFSNRVATHYSLAALLAIVLLLQALVLLHVFTVSSLPYFILTMKASYAEEVVLNAEVYFGVWGYEVSEDKCSKTPTRYEMAEGAVTCSSPRLTHECDHWFLDDNEKGVFKGICDCSGIMFLHYVYFAAHSLLSAATMYLVLRRIDVRRDTGGLRAVSFVISCCCVYFGGRARELLEMCLEKGRQVSLGAFEDSKVEYTAGYSASAGVVCLTVAYLAPILILTTRSATPAERDAAIAEAFGMAKVGIGETFSDMSENLGKAQREMKKARDEMRELRKTLKEKANLAKASKYARGGQGFGGSKVHAADTINSSPYRRDEVTAF